MKKKETIKKLIAISFFYMVAIVGCAHLSEEQARPESKPRGSFYEKVIGIYTGPLNHLRAVRQGECPMYPSCSQYSQDAVNRFGYMKGWIMTTDRLMRCGRDEMRLAKKIFINGRLKYYDPVEINDLWNKKIL